jgi:wobble nucleotide-excising tRNase
MIKKITTVKYIGNFENFNWDDGVPDFETTNIIFGYNGSGKTILSNIFNLFSSQKEDGGKNLFDDLKNNEQATVKIQFDANEVLYKPDGAKHDIFVFNYDFVREHVYDGSAPICKEFDSSVVTEEQLKNPKIQKLETEVESLEKDIASKGNEQKELDDKFEEIKKELSDEFGSKIHDRRVTGVNIPSKAPEDKREELRKRLDGVYGDYALSQKQNELNTYLATLENTIYKELQIDLDSFMNVLKKDISKEAGKKTKENIDSHADFEPTKGTSLNDWFEDGYHLLQHIHEKGEKICPLCNSNIDERIETIIKEYQQYFTDEYTQLSQEIESLIATLNENLNSITENKENIIWMRTSSSKYQKTAVFDEELSFEHEGSIDKINSKLKNKKDNTSLIEDISEEHEVLKQAIKSYNTKVAKVETARANLVKTLQGKALEPEQIVANAKTIVQNLVYAKFNSFKQGDQITNYQNIIREIREFSTQLNTKRAERNREIAALKDESKYLNTFLQHLGIHNFVINIPKENSDENIHIIYGSGITKRKILHALSEGEKTALAFAYFLSKIQYEILDNPQKDITKTTIVIDDPVSSLDENRLHTTACLIRDLFESSEQLFVLSHNLIFLKFFGNMIGHKERKDYYLHGNKKEVQLISLPEGLRNFQTSYFQKLHETMEYNDGLIHYEDAKKFIPNYVRITLETFLSFKLFVLRDKDKYRLAGLRRLTNFLRNNKSYYSDFQPVEDVGKDSILTKLEKIRRITDPQEHGSPQSLEEFNYVSESELKEMVKDALNIIHFLDKTHFYQIKVKEGA